MEAFGTGVEGSGGDGFSFEECVVDDDDSREVTLSPRSNATVLDVDVEVELEGVAESRDKVRSMGSAPALVGFALVSPLPF